MSRKLSNPSRVDAVLVLPRLATLRGLALTCLTFASPSASTITLWSTALDTPPPYMSGGNVTISVQQDGEFRDMIWDVDWYSVLEGHVVMGRTTCPLTSEDLAAKSLETASERQRVVVPCRNHNEEELAGGSDLVRKVVSSVAALGAKRVAMVGLGPGTMATYWQRYHPQVSDIDVAEMSPIVVDAAKRFFGLRTDERLRVHVAEGLTWLKEAPPHDVFVHDATGSEHMFFWPSVLRLICEKTNSGAMVVNILGTPWWLRALALPYLLAHFSNLRVCNDVLIACWSPATLSFAGLPEHVQRWQDPGSWSTYSRLGVLWHTALLIIAVSVFSDRVHVSQEPLRRRTITANKPPCQEGNGWPESR